MHSLSTRRTFLAICTILCLASGTVASDKFLSTFEQILSPNFGRVNAVLRDDRGFLWFGTDRGLCRFDGYQVRVLAIGSLSADKQQIVTSMVRIDSSTILLGTGRGLWIFNLRTEQWSPFLPGADISESQINAVTQDNTGTIWVGTNSHGVMSFNLSSAALQRYTTSNGLSSNRILSLVFDQTGRLWIGTHGGGLNVLERTTSSIIHYRSNTTNPTTLYTDDITALCENGFGELWIGTNEGLNVLQLATGRIRRMHLPSHIKHTIMSLTQDPSGRMWIAALDLGLVFYSHGVFTIFTTLGDAGRSLNSIRTLYPDPVASIGNSLLLWVGTRNGVNKIQMSINPFTNHIRNQDSLYLDRGAVLSICEDRNGIAWTGMWGGGLDMLKRVNGSYQRVANFKNNPANPSSLPHNDVGTIMEDTHGTLWIGTAAGLAMMDARRKQMVLFKHVEGDSTSLAGNDIAGIYEDRSGTMWICTRGGLSEVVPGKPSRFKNYLNDPKEADPVEGNFVSDILEDRDSNLWVATYGRGLNKLTPDGTFQRFLPPGDPTRMEAWIYCLVEDNEGLFWLSTMAGLVSFDPRSGQFVRHQIEQLQDAHIFGIHVDKTNDLWLSTGIGLARFSPKTRSFTRFDKDYGIEFTELRSGFFKGTHGKLFVGGLDGFAEFHPESSYTVFSPPEIAITSWSVFDRELPASLLSAEEARFTHEQNVFTFSFAVLDYAHSRRNRFAYRMVGVDNDWVDAGTRNFASYANLNPGRYAFQVKGSNSNNMWNETGTSVSIVITPPYWQAWWFRILLASLIIAAIYAAYRYRLGKLLEVERLRLRIADDLHDDVGGNLSAIAMVSRVVQRAPELSLATRNKLAEIYDTAIKTSEGMRDIVWFIKPKDDTLGDLLLRMKDTASALLVDMEHEFESPNEETSRRVRIDFKRDFYLAFKEILTNIMKHASASNVSIRVDQRDGLLEATVRDNGKGFDEQVKGKGNGLESLQNRARTIGGTCEVSSAPGRGTTVRFSGKL